MTFERPLRQQHVTFAWALVWQYIDPTSSIIQVFNYFSSYLYILIFARLHSLLLVLQVSRHTWMEKKVMLEHIGNIWGWSFNWITTIGFKAVQISCYVIFKISITLLSCLSLAGACCIIFWILDGYGKSWLLKMSTMKVGHLVSQIFWSPIRTSKTASCDPLCLFL